MELNKKESSKEVSTDSEGKMLTDKSDASSSTNMIALHEKIDKAVQTTIKKFEYEVMRCVNCPIMMECRYPKKRLEKLKEEALKQATAVYDEETELDDSAANVLRAQNIRDLTFKQYIENNAYEVLKNDRCIFEKQEILGTLQKFVDAGYDITDPRTNIIINELVGNLLNSGRSNKAFTSLGILLKKETPAGPIYYENPLLKTKMAFSKLIIEATEALDRILKSDTQQKAEKNFTAHLLQALSIREAGKTIEVKSEETQNETNKIDT